MITKNSCPDNLEHTEENIVYCDDCVLFSIEKGYELENLFCFGSTEETIYDIRTIDIINTAA